MTRMILKKRTYLACATLLLALTAVIGVAGPSWAASWVPSKTITYIVPASPGGGFDTFSRMISPFLRKYLPGNARIVIRNVPGGGWNIGIAKLYRAKPDGHTIGILNLPGNIVNQVVRAAKFDLRKITWLGNLGDVTYVACLALKSKFKSLKDAQNAPQVIAGIVGIASADGLGTLIASQRMGIKMKFIPHNGSTQSILSAIRGDVDWVQYPFSTLKKFIVDSRDLLPVLVYSKKRIKLLPNVPTVAELGYPELADTVKLYRATGGPPGLPEDVAKVWKNAFWKATNDPEFQKKQIAANAVPLPMRPEQLEAVVEAAIKSISKYKDIIKKNLK